MSFCSCANSKKAFGLITHLWREMSTGLIPKKLLKPSEAWNFNFSFRRLHVGPKKKKKCFLMLEQCWCFPGQGFVWKINTAEQSFPALARALLFLCPVCAACIPHLSSHYRALPAEAGCGHACTLFFLFPLLGNSDSFANSSHWNWAFYVVYHERGKLGTVAVTLQRDCSSHFAVLNLLWCL